MLIDYSGSMSSQLSNVLDQVIHSVLFCKAVNIPFNVYSFSTECQADVNHNTQDGDVWMDNLSLCQLIHSKLNKNKLETALKWLYARTNAARGVSSDWVKAREEDWGSTPLNQALIISHKLIKEFKLKNNIEKVTLLSITDGDTNRLRIIDDKNIERKNMPIIGRATCNKIMWKPLLGALNQVIKEGLADTLSKEEFQKSGGCYAPRRINRFNAGGAISRHAWGIAIDINVKSGYHPRVVEIFNSWGFAWGGTWTSPDEMHFELRDLSPSISQSSG